MGSDGDKSGHTDLCLAHVGQGLFEMLWRSRGMARGELARICKHKKSEGQQTLLHNGKQMQRHKKINEKKKADVNARENLLLTEVTCQKSS